jgi:hypothetical protein
VLPVHAKRIALVMGNDNYQQVARLQKAGSAVTPATQVAKLNMPNGDKYEGEAISVIRTGKRGSTPLPIVCAWASGSTTWRAGRPSRRNLTMALRSRIDC